MFREKKYLCRLVKALHPEMEVTESDIKDETLECILANGIYNDLGFTVKDKAIIMLEAQSTRDCKYFTKNVPLFSENL